ncbi:MAG TPA: hypothetical protein VMF08_23735 [Candidatus Sulfotelmatobacter sp.]|nr:hypothetical protein [Candidatus Sulfotelmatobacter sp.]
MKRVTKGLAVLIASISLPVFAGQDWQAALSRMPLGTRVTELNRTNCIPLILNAFQSNSVVKAIIFMPGATDELYFFKRAHATLSGPNPSLGDAITALTNQSYIQADFRPPFLLLHTTEDALDPIAVVRNKSTAARLQAQIVPDRFVFVDSEWDDVRAALKKKLSVSLRPFSNAPISWHFYRHNFAACGLTQWQLLEAVAMAGQTGFTVHWFTADFQSDMRPAGPTPGF